MLEHCLASSKWNAQAEAHQQRRSKAEQDDAAAIAERVVLLLKPDGSLALRIVPEHVTKRAVHVKPSGKTQMHACWHSACDGPRSALFRMLSGAVDRQSLANADINHHR